MSETDSNLKQKKYRSKPKKRKTPLSSFEADNGTQNGAEGDSKETQAQNIKLKKQNISNNGRDYSSDLKEYLISWKHKDTMEWKFSKVIQSWALLNCFSIDKVSEELFEMLLPYISTVQGGARTRIIEVATNIINAECDVSTQNQNVDNPRDNLASYAFKIARAEVTLKVLNT